MTAQPTLRERLAKVPTPMGGLALGIASLGWAWENLMPAHGLFQLAGAGVAAILLLLLLAKFMHHPRLLWVDLQNPVAGSVMPTIAMALMVIAKAVSLFSLPVAEAVWLFAIALHLVFLAIFSYHRFRAFRLHHMVPSWFVPPVGIIVAAVTFPGGSWLWLAQLICWFGIICYLVMLPVMLYRLVFSAEVPDAAKPTIAILAAPASLSLAGYLTVFATPSPLMVGLLAGIAVLMTAIIYLFFLRLLRLPFSPGYSAFTFPMVIGATALYKLSVLIGNWGFAARYAEQVHALATFELIVAALVIAYVSLHYLYNYLVRVRQADATPA
ncbi:TDT family transporter [Laribacter hongkongensis]|uniref:TDT family transporter n=1 Tax=Laribacter hongkongensis TaxID=168471 RepID=UPI001EFC9B19|nr:TDT family transporter [Laribacter hongkongensis]MCG9078652.1 TDT family transporter [Laribacter hongkongensis]